MVALEDIVMVCGGGGSGTIGVGIDGTGAGDVCGGIGSSSGVCKEWCW